MKISDNISSCDHNTHSMSGKNILITGSTGFIGRNLIATDASNNYISLTRDILDLSKPFPRPLDVPGFNPAVDGIDTVIHLATPRIIHAFDPITAHNLFTVNVSATQELLEYAHGIGANKFIYISTGNVGREQKPSFYTISKQCGEMVSEYYREYMHVTILRPIYVYGVGQETNKLIPRLINSVKNGDPIYLNGGKYGDYISPTYIYDMVSCIRGAIDFDGGITTDVSGNEGVCLRDIAEYIGELIGKDPIFEYREENSATMIGDMLYQQLLFKPVVSWKDGVAWVVKILMGYNYDN